jgi:hypothetical protein
MDRLQETFRARDSQGLEYEIKAYLDVHEVHQFGGGPSPTTGGMSAKATMIGSGSVFEAVHVEGDTYKLIGMSDIMVTRIR